MPSPSQPTHDGPAERPLEPPETRLPLHLTALTQVAEGVAPALNELLAVITGRASLLLDQAETDAATRESLSEIYTAGERAVSLIR